MRNASKYHLKIKTDKSYAKAVAELGIKAQYVDITYEDVTGIGLLAKKRCKCCAKSLVYVRLWTAQWLLEHITTTMNDEVVAKATKRLSQLDKLKQ